MPSRLLLAAFAPITAFAVKARDAVPVNPRDGSYEFPTQCPLKIPGSRPLVWQEIDARAGPPDPAHGAVFFDEKKATKEAELAASADLVKCPHGTCRVSQIYKDYIDKTRKQVHSWSVDVAKPSATEKTAVTIFQPARDVELFEYAIRTNMHRLGRDWALQVFYGAEEDKAVLDDALGNPVNVQWTPIVINGTRLPKINKNVANFFRLSDFFWGKIPQNHEHVLIFESDSLVLRGNGCIENYFEYDYVGAPWDTNLYWGRSHPPELGGNGGFTLRRRSSMVKAIKSEYNKLNMQWLCWLHEHRNVWSWAPNKFTQNEDGELVGMLLKMGGKFPSRAQAKAFAVETFMDPNACAFHNPWENLKEDEARELLQSAQTH